MAEAIGKELLKLPLRNREQTNRRVVASVMTATAHPERPFSADIDRLNQEFSEHQSLVSEFLRLNRNSATLPCMNPTPSVLWVSEERIRALWDFGSESWIAHLERLEPQAAGLGGFSDVALSIDGQSAIAYAFLQYGDLGGEGKYWLLTKSKNGWKVAKRVDIWIS